MNGTMLNETKKKNCSACSEKRPEKKRNNANNHMNAVMPLIWILTNPFPLITPHQVSPALPLHHTQTKVQARCPDAPAGYAAWAASIRISWLGWLASVASDNARAQLEPR